MNKLSEKQANRLSIIFLLLVSAAAFLPLAKELGFYNDDWYLLYAGQTQGIDKFHDIFSSDRPARAFLVGFFYQLFGTRALLYTINAWFLRFLTGLCLYWISGRLWRQQFRARLLTCVLFVVYPGFLNQPNAFDYQSHLVSFMLAMLSIALTVKAVTEKSRVYALLWHAVAALTGLVYMALMEYYIGMEVLRLVLVWYLLRQSQNHWHTHVGHTLLNGLPTILSTLAFFIWRVFFFNNQRVATDIQGMFGGLAASPIYQGLWLLVYMVQDIFNVTFSAWVVPTYDLAFRMRLRDTLIAGALVTGVLAVFFLFDLWMKRDFSDQCVDNCIGSKSTWWQDAIWIGLAGVVGSLIPVAFGSRHVVFSDYSRFSLPGSPGAALLLTGILFALKRDGLRRALAGVMVAAALVTHFANATQYASQWETMRSFWWQVSWRVPQLQDGVTLIANYPDFGIAEDYFVWGPANLIYRPQRQEGEILHVRVPAAVLNSNTLLMIMTENGEETVNRREILLQRDFSNILVLSMPSLYSCVQVMDEEQTMLSSYEEENIILSAPFSRMSAIQTESSGFTPPSSIFGEEPDHDWCYYYQKINLEIQRGDWEAAMILANEAEGKGLRPADIVEWVPVAQAYAYMGDVDRLQSIASIIKSDPYINLQTCQLFSADAAGMNQIYPESQRLLVETFCY